MKIAKNVGLRVLVLVVSWLLGSVTVGMLPVFIAANAHTAPDYELIGRANTGFIIFGTWVFYRIFSRVFKFPRPRGGRLTAINVAWAFFAYGIVGGAVELVIGHPTLAAGFVGIPLAIVLYLLLAARSKPAETT